jgi:hypothetical protein
MTHDLTESLRKVLKPKPQQATMDAVDGGTSLAGADSYTETDIKLKAAAAVQQWTETDDLEEGETNADRLLALMVGIADANKDGEISDDEQGVLDIALNAAWDYLSAYGVDDEDAGALLNDWDSDAADRIKDLVAASLPEGEAADADIDQFAFGEDQEPMLDAVYKKTVAVRHGKKVRISKRISGTVRLSARQKLAIRKAQAKSHNAQAMMRRAKSMKVRKQRGL